LSRRSLQDWRPADPLPSIIPHQFTREPTPRTSLSSLRLPTSRAHPSLSPPVFPRLLVRLTRSFQPSCSCGLRDAQQLADLPIKYAKLVPRFHTCLGAGCLDGVFVDWALSRLLAEHRAVSCSDTMALDRDPSRDSADPHRDVFGEQQSW